MVKMYQIVTKNLENDKNYLEIVKIMKKNYITL